MRGRVFSHKATSRRRTGLASMPRAAAGRLNGVAGEAARQSPAPAPGTAEETRQSPSPAPVDIDSLAEELLEVAAKALPNDVLVRESRAGLAMRLETLVKAETARRGVEPDPLAVRDIVTFLLNELLTRAKETGADPLARDQGGLSNVEAAKEQILPLVLEHIDPKVASELPRGELAAQIGDVVGELLVQEKINLNLKEQRDLVTLIINDMLGLGPLEPLLADESITDIMVNGPHQVYVERGGKLELTDVRFRDDRHLMNVIQRIVTAVGRRIDESSPICDARLADGSRVNAIIPPLAIDGPSLSIRKFAKKKITLEKMVAFGSISPRLMQLLKIIGACRLNVLVSGGTGSGKTTMLNAISRLIDPGERIVTIEDAAELQLQQPHVVRLETRPPNLEGKGEVTMRDLVRNALRMRPDRIIVGEIRGAEAVDLLQAMNTGHDGSMGTIHANRPREALTRLENMVNMAGFNLPAKAIREQIAAAVDIIIQVSRMRDGARRCVYVTEVVGMEGDVITTQDLFRYEYHGEDQNGRLVGDFVPTGVRPHFLPRAQYFGLDKLLLEVMGGGS